MPNSKDTYSRPSDTPSFVVREDTIEYGFIGKLQSLKYEYREGIDTYQFRKEEDRYSKRIGMERIAEEGYNLNISRYISTAVGEEEIDLAATHASLVEIENAIQIATAKHNEFLKELEKPLLPSAD
ncbi:MAG TPA: hypothetical protein DCQ77_01380 [Betaproteobacteria bacterium]|nr:hypothetical protein [Betaproteobacteria bacterium]